MASLSRQFERVAQAITEGISELLCARVAVIDDRGEAVASKGLESANLLSPIPNFRIPICCDGRFGEVIITKPDNDEVISPRLVQVLVEMLVKQTVAVAQLPDRHELKNKFIHDLLRGTIAEEADILRQGQILGMDFSRPRAVILIDATDYILTPTLEEGHKTAQFPFTKITKNSLQSPHFAPFIFNHSEQRSQVIINSIVSFFHLPSDTICAYIGDGEVAVLKASATQDLVLWAERGGESSQSNPSWADLVALKRSATALLTRLRCDTKTAISIGIGRHHPGIQGLAKSYQDARAALSLGRCFQGPNQVHCLDELGIAAFVGISDERTKIDLAKHLLSPLDQQVDLLETIDAFFLENCCPSTTAKRLSIHRNTLSYRLDKIASLTGLDLRRFDDAMQIRLALLLSSLKGQVAQSCQSLIPKTA
ncbi:MAG: PucR family transcriptional regulator [Actinomycetota bacterium]